MNDQQICALCGISKRRMYALERLLNVISNPNCTKGDVKRALADIGAEFIMDIRHQENLETPWKGEKC